MWAPPGAAGPPRGRRGSPRVSSAQGGGRQAPAAGPRGWPLCWPSAPGWARGRGRRALGNCLAPCGRSRAHGALGRGHRWGAVAAAPRAPAQGSVGARCGAAPEAGGTSAQCYTGGVKLQRGSRGGRGLGRGRLRAAAARCAGRPAAARRGRAGAGRGYQRGARTGRAARAGRRRPRAGGGRGGRGGTKRRGTRPMSQLKRPASRHSSGGRGVTRRRQDS
jgi:hypothetical protein